MDEAELLSDSIFILDKGKIISKGTMANLRNTLNYKIRVDINELSSHNNNINIKDMFGSFGKVIDISSTSIRLFTFESYLKEISGLAINNNLSYSVAPITLDDIFVNMLGKFAN